MLSHLPWSHDHDQPPSQEDKQSLTSILTPEQRSDLTLLIASSTASMRTTLVSAYDSTPDSSPDPPKSGDAFLNAPTNLADIDVEKEDKLRQEAVDRKKELEEELAQPETVELKQKALEYFEAWRDTVLQRVGEVVNSKAEAREQGKHPTRSASPDTGTRRLSPTPQKQDEGVAEALRDIYPPIKTELRELEEPKRALVLHSLVLLLLSLEQYSAHSRILLLHLTSSLGLSVEVLAEDESNVARGLLEAVKQQMNADKETKKKAEENHSSRKWKVGLASVAGAALIGVTGGLAAPLLAAGVGSVMGGLGLGATAAAGYLGTLASSTVIVGGLFGAYGARMTGKMMDEYAKEVDDFGFVPIRNFHRPRKIEKEFRRLRVAIGISGWLTDKEEVVVPWRVIGPSIEGFALRWELEALLKLGNSLTIMVQSAAWSYAKHEIIKRTVFAALSAGLWPLGLLKVSRIIDNPFSVAKARSDKAGEVLADALINKVQGERPVTLVGYSLGARVIYTCLQTLAERKAFGLVESVVLMGAPTPSTSNEWRKIRSVVSGRVVNVYSTNDYILAFLYRTSSIQYGVAGLQKVEDIKGIQNVDVSELVSGHTRYRWLAGTILKKIGFEDVDLEEVAREEADLKKVEEEQKKEAEKKEQKEKGKDADEEAKDMEKEVEKKNEDSIMSWATEKLKISSGAFSKLGSMAGVTGGKKTEAEEMAEKDGEKV
ncbi:DUF726-domain-containing protein [Mytilinidion resinicola]|uniref:DUF726-domain-containing protein n=1 Tax=Mytilinidion resinicola TaxID=574789 RepID=A0A6A6Y5U1_9PEZI|nr:DUF726-domain-containing protein [Mytilinidion resinicola]KAF2803595.1 DUF726-domain-containing protein [Mytilinidion resinicola]